MGVVRIRRAASLIPQTPPACVPLHDVYVFFCARPALLILPPFTLVGPSQRRTAPHIGTTILTPRCVRLCPMRNPPGCARSFPPPPCPPPPSVGHPFPRQLLPP